MGSIFQEYSIVRVIKLRRTDDEYDGWKVNQRPPQIGDIGTVLNILHAANLPIL